MWLKLSTNNTTWNTKRKQIKKIFLRFYLLHTYIIGHYNLSVRIIDLDPHITHVVCVNFIHKWWDIQFVNVDSRMTDFLRKFSWYFHLLSELVLIPGQTWNVAWRLISQRTTYYTTATLIVQLCFVDTWVLHIFVICVSQRVARYHEIAYLRLSIYWQNIVMLLSLRNV